MLRRRFILSLLGALLTVSLLGPPAPAQITGPGSTIPWNGGDWYLLGNDYAWWNYGTDFGAGGWGKYTDWNAITTDFSRMRNQGVHVVRWWVFADGRYDPKFSPDGTVSGVDGQFWTDLDRALQLAADNRITLLLTVIDSSMWANAAFSGSVQMGGHAALVTDSRVQQTFLDNALAPLLQHVAASPNQGYVLGYDIVNEPEGQMADYWNGTARLQTADVRAFVQACAGYIHLYGGPAYATVGSAMPQWVSLWTNLGLDFYQLHYYPGFDGGGPPGSGLPTYASLNLDRPCIVGEFATNDAGYQIGNTVPLSAQWYLDTIYNDGYAGALGWSYRAGDSATNWNAFQPVFSNWSQGYDAVSGPQ